MSLLSQSFESFARGAKFLLAGAVAAIVQYVVLIIGAQFIAPLIASIIGYVLAIPINYLMNYYLTFASKDKHIHASPKFLFVCVTSLILNALVFWMATRAGLYYILAQTMAAIAVIIWNYVGLSLWALR